MGSWGRHGWPRKDEVMRLYRERDGSYMMVDVPIGRDGTYAAIANALEGPEPSLATTGVSPSYLLQAGCKRVQWSELPREWKAAFLYWLSFDKIKPRDVRGFWLVGNQPAPQGRAKGAKRPPCM